MVITLFGVLGVACSESSESDRPLSGTQLASGMRAAFAEASLFERLTRLTELVDDLDDDNLRAGRDVFGEYVAGLSDAEVRIFMSAWARRDPSAALDYASAIPFTTQREEAIAVVIQEWAARDPLEARPRAEALVIPGRKRAAQPVVRLVRGWVHHPDSGLEAYLHERPKRSDLLSAALQEVYRLQGATHLMRWVEDFISEDADSEHSWQTFRKAVRTIGYRDPEAAAAWVSEHHGRGYYASDGPEVLAEAWGLRDPGGAIDWIRTGAPEAARAKSLEAVFRLWLRHDRSAAREWLDAHRDDPFARPAALAAARDAIGAKNPEGAIELCSRIPPSELLQSCLHALALQWYEYDPVAAGLWMESSALDPELRDSVRSVKQRLRRPGAGIANK
jgi:hypothetical protein